MVYLPTFPLECGHCSPNVGKYTIHESYGVLLLQPLKLDAEAKKSGLESIFLLFQCRYFHVNQPSVLFSGV